MTQLNRKFIITIRQRNLLVCRGRPSHVDALVLMNSNHSIQFPASRFIRSSFFLWFRASTGLYFDLVRVQSDPLMHHILLFLLFLRQ